MQASNWNTMGTLGAQALKDMDRSRKARGEMLDRAGYGPQQTPSTVLYSEPGLNVRRYGAPADITANGGPAVLIVPAPIKRPYIWDLAPGISVVRRWLDRGYRVYLAEWVALPDTHDHFGLEDYADHLLSACRRAIAADGGPDQVVIAGHSLGGILTAIHSCLHPDAIRATILLESPLHFTPQSSCFARLVDATPHARPIADAFRQEIGRASCRERV